MKNANTNSELKKAIQTECNFTNKTITMINGISLIGRNDLPELIVSNKHCMLKTYTPAAGNQTMFFNPPFTYKIQ
jgi:hypothetical protein